MELESAPVIPMVSQYAPKMLLTGAVVDDIEILSTGANTTVNSGANTPKPVRGYEATAMEAMEVSDEDDDNIQVVEKNETDDIEKLLRDEIDAMLEDVNGLQLSA